MSEIFLTNTLSRKKEKFKPIKSEKVGIYTCGPTVYRNVHIGNLRTYISADLLKRVFLYNDYKVTHVKNITDVGHMRTTGADSAYDPVITEAIKKGKSPQEISESYTKAFQKDEEKLNIIPANENPKATDHIKEMIALTEKLLEKGFAYETDGNIYFKVKEFKDYGKLSGNTLDRMDQLLEAVRVSVETDKKDSADFSLWKKAEEGRIMVWDSPWGKGFPGWHIECSAMATKYLGNHFDIHTGGEDLVFPHHEDEIAQTEAAYKEKYVNYWVHSGYLLVENKKMSRSAGNYFILEDIIKKGFNPLAFRYLTLTTHYKSRLNFTWKALEAAQTALNNLYREVSSYKAEEKVGCSEFEQRFLEAVNNDLDFPKALVITQELVASNYPDTAKLESLLRFDQVLGLGLEQLIKIKVPDEVNNLVNQRENARKDKNFSKSDELRRQIADLGYEVVDEKDGPKLKKIL